MALPLLVYITSADQAYEQALSASCTSETDDYSPRDDWQYYAVPSVTSSPDLASQANWLRSVGVKKGDAVSIYMPMVAELPIAMLACARIGAVHSVVFAGFSAESLAQRIDDCRCNVLLTCNGAAKVYQLLAGLTRQWAHGSFRRNDSVPADTLTTRR